MLVTGVQYLAAVRLLREATTVSKVAGARLTRFAAALDLADNHRLALVQSAANRNMEVGNYRSVAGCLCMLTVQSSSESRHEPGSLACLAHQPYLGLGSRYASEQLSWLATKSSGVAPPSYLKQLQQQILECDQKGRNASIPASALSTFQSRAFLCCCHTR